MADHAPTPLGLADQVLINAAGVLCCRVHGEPERDDLWLDVLREVLPQVNRKIPMIDQLAGAAELVLAEAPKGAPRGRDWAWRLLGLGAAVLRVLEFRGGNALDQLRSKGVAA